MSTEEILTCVVCALVGYRIISAMIGNTSKPKLAPETGPAWYDVLAVSKDASLDEIQAAYRALISQYHPDKVASLGEDIRALAEVKSRDINKAYSDALAAVGSRL